MAKAKDFQPNGEETVISEFLELAAARIWETYGHKVAIKGPSELNFGRNRNVDTTEIEVTQIAGLAGASEDYQTGNTITHISSSDAGDTQVMEIRGYTLNDGKFTEVIQQVTLAGQTKTALGTPVARSVRGYNTGSTDLAGDVYVYQDVAVAGGVPSDLTAAHLVVTGEDNQSLHSTTTIEDGRYFIPIGVYAYMNKQTNGVADIKFKIREPGGVFRTVFIGGISEGSGLERKLQPFGLVPPNSDISVTATGSANNLDISAGFEGVYADIINT